MLRRYYTVTKGITLGYSDLGKVVEDKVTSIHEQESHAILQSQKLTTDLHSSLFVFIEYELAKQFAEESKTYYPSYREETKKTQYLPSSQPAVVEIYAAPELLDKMICSTIKSCEPDELKTQVKKPKDPDKEYQAYHIPNKPQHYVTYRYSIGDNGLNPLHTLVPETYKAFFPENASPLKSILSLFQDYHSPKLFSLHWRHHKDFARRITKALTSESTLKEAYKLLFNLRRELMIEQGEVNLTGSFMRRIDFALKKLRDAGADSFELNQVHALRK